MAIVRVLIGIAIALAAADVTLAEDVRTWLGIEAVTVTDAVTVEHSLPVDFGAYVTAVRADSPAGHNIRPGDVITRVNMQVVRSKEEFEAEIAKLMSGGTLHLGRVRAGEAAKTITLTLAGQSHTRPSVSSRDAPLLMLNTDGHMASIKSLTFTPDGNQIVSAGDDKVIRVWNWRTGRTIRTIRAEAGLGSEGKIYAMALSPDGKWLAAGGSRMPGETGNLIRLYDFGSGRMMALLRGHDGSVNRLAFSADAKHLISGSNDNTAIIWDVANAKPIHHLTGHTRDIYGVAFTPDGIRVVTASFDTTLRLWQVTDGSLIAVLNGHTGLVRTLAVSPTDGRIASGDSDGVIRLWNGKTGQPILSAAGDNTFANRGGWVGVLRFSPDGKALFSGSAEHVRSNNDCRVWGVAPGGELIRSTHHIGV